MKRKKVTTSFELYKNIPVVKVLFTTGEYGYFLIDTGASITIWDKSFVDKNKKVFDIQGRQSVSTVTSATNVSEAIPTFDATTKVAISISKKDVLMCDITGIIMDIKHITKESEIPIVGIFSSDYLQSSEAIIDFKDNTLTFRNDLCSKQND